MSQIISKKVRFLLAVSSRRSAIGLVGWVERRETQQSVDRHRKFGVFSIQTNTDTVRNRTYRVGGISESRHF